MNGAPCHVLPPHKRWYNTPRWRKKRAKQLADNPLCKFCLATGRRVAASVADHVVPHRGDEYSFWHGELQSLCYTCHNSVKQRMETATGLQPVGIDGWPTSPAASLKRATDARPKFLK